MTIVGSVVFFEKMKATLFALFLTLLLFGCGSPDLDDPETSDEVITEGSPDLDDLETLNGIIAEAINKDTLQKRSKEREELLYAPNQQKFYTGWIKEMWNKEQIKTLIQYKDGKRNGLLNRWYENGQKKSEANYKDGKEDGQMNTWYENGHKRGETIFKDGKANGLTIIYNEDGTEKSRRTYKNGERVKD